MTRESSSIRRFGVAAFFAASLFTFASLQAQQHFDMHASAMQVGAPFSVHIEGAYPNSEWFLAADIAEGKYQVPGMPRLVIGLAVTPSFVTFPHWFADPSGKGDLTLQASQDMASIGVQFFGQCFNFDPRFPSGMFSSNVEKLVVHPPAPGLGADRLLALGDDGSQLFPLPFAFPFYGTVYTEMYVNANGNVTFLAADASHGGDLFQFAGSLPRIAPLFADLSANYGSVSVDSTAIANMAVTVHFDHVRDMVSGGAVSFDLTLFSGGHIEIAYGDVTVDHAIVGLSPGSDTLGALADIQAPGVQGFALTAPIVEMFDDATPFTMDHDLVSFLYFTGSGYLLLR